MGLNMVLMEVDVVLNNGCGCGEMFVVMVLNVELLNVLMC